MAIAALKTSLGIVVEAIEESTLVINCAFKDEDGNAEDVKTLTWTLTDKDGTVINEREQVSVVTPSSTEDIVLSGDDLAILSGETAANVERRFLVEATYDSDLGDDLPLKDSCKFYIRNLVAALTDIGE